MSTATRATSGGVLRFRGSFPCPVCGGTEDDDRGAGRRCFGFLSSDREYAHCTRDEHAGALGQEANSETYPHRLHGPCRCGKTHGEAKGGKERLFVYRDRGGRARFLVKRIGDGKGKKIWQERPDGQKGLGGVEPILYRLPELAEADPSRIVFVVEGEPKVDALAKLGQVATCNPMGALKWRDHYSEDLRGRHVVILPDNDEPEPKHPLGKGRQHAEQVAASVLKVAESVKIVELPGLPSKGDIVDWLAAGNTLDDLMSLVGEAPSWTPPGKPEASLSGKGLDVIPIRTPGDKPARRMLTDTGNAERLVDRHGADIRFCHPWKRWLHWDGKRWALDDTGAVRRKAKSTVRAIYREAEREQDDDKRKAVVQWGINSEKRERINAMLGLAEIEEGVPILPAEMDLDPWLFNCPNGSIDLRTGELRPHQREDCITKLCPTPYDPNATCPLWEATLDKFLAGNPELIAYLQKILGYALTGVIRDHLLPVAWGKGSNGKSTILGTALEVWGPDYAMKCPPDMLMAKKHEGHPTERADLFGKRLVVAIETEAGRRLNESLIKELTGGDRIRARRMREDNWEFSPTHTLLMATNHKPRVKGTDYAIWRRLKLVPFNVTVSGAGADKEMPAKLRAEYPGILAWCVRGCLRWQAEGLDDPAEVAEATQGYRKEQDTLGAFIDECAVEDRRLEVKASVIYARYRQWAEAANERAMSLRVFGEEMAERGYGTRTSNGKRYQGIALRPEPGEREEGEI